MIPDEEREGSIEKADTALVKLEHRAQSVMRLLIVSLLIAVVGLSTATGYLINQSNGETARINKAVAAAAIDATQKRQALCGFFDVLGTAPVPANTTKIGVQLVLDSRIAYDGLGCKPSLPPVPDSLKALAVKFNITIPKGLHGS